MHKKTNTKKSKLQLKSCEDGKYDKWADVSWNEGMFLLLDYCWCYFTNTDSKHDKLLS